MMGWSPGGDIAADTSIYQRFNQIVVQKRSKNHGLLKIVDREVCKAREWG